MQNELTPNSFDSLEPLTDSFKRKHTYLRISLLEKCNLRCTYCMPEEGVQLSPSAKLMTAKEIVGIVKSFVESGVTKIRLTGGEPLLRKDFESVYTSLSELPVELSITTNAVLLGKYLPLFREKKLLNINISLDTLKRERFFQITRRDQFDLVMKNIYKALEMGISPRLNVVLVKEFNEDEIIDFINLTKKQPITVRFIEFMPFEGNEWKREKLVSLSTILKKTIQQFGEDQLTRLTDKPNDTSKNYKIKNFVGSFSVISTVTNPFCDSCNRIRLTANGTIKNCLFSNNEVNILDSYRKGNPIMPIVKKVLLSKEKIRGGMDTLDQFIDPNNNQKNRSMILIGG